MSRQGPPSRHWRSVSAQTAAAPASISLVFAEPEHAAPAASAVSSLPPPSLLKKQSSSVSMRVSQASTSVAITIQEVTDVFEEVAIPVQDEVNAELPRAWYSRGRTAERDYSMDTPMPDSSKSSTRTPSKEVPAVDTTTAPILNLPNDSSPMSSSPQRAGWFGSIRRSHSKDIKRRRLTPIPVAEPPTSGIADPPPAPVSAPISPEPPITSTPVSFPISRLATIDKTASVSSSPTKSWFSTIRKRPSREADKIITSPPPPTRLEASTEATTLPQSIAPLEVKPVPTLPISNPSTRPPSPNKGGWFGLRKPSSAEPNSQTSVPTASTEPVSAPPIVSESQSTTLPISIPNQQIPSTRSAGWFGSRPNPVPSTTPELVGSFEERAPTPAPTKNSPPVSSSINIEGPQSNNPPTTRYTLSLPLLGRPKPKLEEVLAQAAKAEKAVKATAVDKSPVGETPSITVTKTPEEPVTVSDDKKSTPAPGSGSWWEYIGLSGSAALDPLVEENIVATEGELSVPPAAGSPSTHSGNTASSAPAWYSPWAWYGGSAPRDEAVNGKTPSEMIKEAALAREDPCTTVSQPPEATMNPIVNPENRSTWVTFFSSKTVVTAANSTKKIKDHAEISEVMDLEEDFDAPEGVVTAAKPSTDTTPSIPAKVKAIPATAPPSPTRSQHPTQKDSQKKANSVAPSLTNSEAVKRKNGASASTAITPSKPSSSKKSVSPPSTPNLVLPTFADTFYTLPRAIPPSALHSSKIRKTLDFVSGMLFTGQGSQLRHKEMEEYQRLSNINVREVPLGKAAKQVGGSLPRVWEVLGERDGGVRNCRRVAIIGIHGWFPGAIMRSLLGEPTGTSPKFASMMETAVQEYMSKHGLQAEKITRIPLEGDGTISRRVEKLYREYISRPEWVEDLQRADVVFVATHSQGSIVATQLLDRLIAEGHIRTDKNVDTVAQATASVAAGAVGLVVPPTLRLPQRVCCLALCGIHLGPLTYLNTSSLVQPYIQYLESEAARELFEFQDTESQVSKTYVQALTRVLNHGTKFVYVASLNDQVVPVYSGIFTAVNHPLILRALYIDGDAYNSSDFLSNLLVLLLRIRNAGLDDGGLLTHLSEATAGSLSGVGHSSAYLDSGSYALAVRFLFETSGALGEDLEMQFEPFTARTARNDYEIPWALRDLIAQPATYELFAKEFAELRAAFDDWQPRTSILRDVRRKLEPIRGRSRFAQSPSRSTGRNSKL